MARSVKFKQVLSCALNPAGSKYPYRLKCLEKAINKIDETQSVETVEVVGVNSLVEVPKGAQLVVVTSGVMTERIGREIKSVLEWERVDALIPAGANSDKILHMLATASQPNTTSTANNPAGAGASPDSSKKT